MMFVPTAGFTPAMALVAKMLLVEAGAMVTTTDGARAGGMRSGGGW
jgi:hypothetical protein